VTVWHITLHQQGSLKAARRAAEESPMIGRPARALAAAITFVAALAPSAPLASAGTATPSSGPMPSQEDLLVDASVALDSEILALVALGAFGDAPPPELVAVHDEWRGWIDGIDRPGLIEWAVEADGEGAAALAGLVRQGLRPTPAIDRAVGALTPEDGQALTAGRPLPGDPLLYVRAREHLDQMLAGGTLALPPTSPADDPQAPRITIPVTAPAMIAVTTAAPTPATTPVTQVAQSTQSTRSTTATGGGGGGGRDATTTLILLASLMVGVGVAAFATATRRRSDVAGRVRRTELTGTDTERFDALAEAARQMASALDQREIAGIALDHGLAMTRARHGAYIEVDEVGLTAAATTGDVFAVRSLTGGLLSRVADTGQLVRRVAHDEPAITSLPAALMAAPVIGGGRVIGILFLVRADSTPFSDDDEAAITRLTPIVASALAAASRHDTATALSRTDPLTGLANRRTLDEDIADVRAFASPGRCNAIAMIDVDHFKLFNDREGHSAGDDALRAVARTIEAAVRPGDRVYRYGGEEFAMLLDDIDPLEAELVAERVRELVHTTPVPGSEGQPGGALTVSIGVALVNGADPHPSLQLADRALYAAKSAGRNRVVLIDATNAAR
jgi:diguanylate cyclase (GGDEF)-like protein